MRVGVFGVEEFDDLEAAFVHIKMDVALFHIGRVRFPNDGFGEHLFHRLPHAKAKLLPMRGAVNVKQIQRVEMIGADGQHHAAR